MYIRRVEHTLRDISNSQPIPSYLSSYNVPTQKNSGGNGLLNFGVALGGIFLVTIITGIITYLYRKKFNCKQKESSTGSKESNGNISSIMDYYSNNYIMGKDGNNNDNPNNDKNDALGSGITNDTTIKTNKSGCNIMNIIKCNIGETSNKSSNDKKKSKNSSDKTKSNKSKGVTTKNKRSKSVPIENRSRSGTRKNNRSKSMKHIKRSSNERIEYIIPQISSPISMPSASIYDIERASTLANSLSRSTAFQFQTPPTPPIPIRSSIIDKQPKNVERSSDSQQKLNSFYNLIPFIFMDSETETNTNIGPTVPQKKTTSVETTSSAGVIPDWSKAPWNDDLTFHKNNNDNNDNSNNNNNNNNNNDNDDDNDNDDNNNDDDDNDNDDDSNNNGNNNYDNNSLNSSRYSEDLIRFSNGSKYSTSNSRYRIDQQVSSPKPDSNTNDNPESSESKSQQYKRSFIDELKINIEKDPEKYEFLKNPTENHHNWKRNGNFFEYRLQRSKTII